MTKELKALERIRKARYFVDYELDAKVGEDYKEELDIIETALKRLEQLKEEKALLIHMLKVLRDKYVNYEYLSSCSTAKDYNWRISSDYGGVEKNCKDLYLTKKEFDLLKEVLL